MNISDINQMRIKILIKIKCYKETTFILIRKAMQT